MAAKGKFCREFYVFCILCLRKGQGKIMASFMIYFCLIDEKIYFSRRVILDRRVAYLQTFLIKAMSLSLLKFAGQASLVDEAMLPS